MCAGDAHSTGADLLESVRRNDDIAPHPAFDDEVAQRMGLSVEAHLLQLAQAPAILRDGRLAAQSHACWLFARLLHLCACGAEFDARVSRCDNPLYWRVELVAEWAKAEADADRDERMTLGSDYHMGQGAACSLGVAHSRAKMELADWRECRRRCLHCVIIPLLLRASGQATWRRPLRWERA